MVLDKYHPFLCMIVERGVIGLKKKKVSSKRIQKTVKSVRAVSKNNIWGVDKDFILIVGGAFVLIVFGMMLFF